MTPLAADLPGAVDRAQSRRWWIAAVLLITVVFGFFDRISVAVLFSLPDFQNAMGTGFDPAMLGLLMGVFLLAYAFSAMFLSFVGDLFGHKRSLLVSTGIWGVAMAGMGAAASYPVMLLGRVVLGLAEGPQFSFASGLIPRWFPSRDQGRANSIWLIGAPLGSAQGFPLIGGFLVPSYGWRVSFYILGAVNLMVVVPLILFVVRERPSGAAVARAAPVARTNYLAAMRSFMGDGKFWILASFNFGAVIYLWGLNAWLPTYLVRSHGLDLQNAGVLSSLPFIMMLLGEIGGAAACDRVGRHALLAGCGMLLAAVTMFVGTRMSTPLEAVVAMGFSAMGWGIAVPTYFTLALRVLPPTAVATGTGVLNGLGNIAGALAPVLIGVIVAKTGSFDSGLMVLVAAPLCAAASMFALHRLRYGAA